VSGEEGGRLLVIKGGGGEPSVSRDTVALLEDALEAAKTGKLTAIAIAAVTDGHGVSTAFNVGCDEHITLLAAISHLHFRLNQHIEDHHDG
jgi:hypothetical protein